MGRHLHGYVLVLPVFIFTSIAFCNEILDASLPDLLENGEVLDSSRGSSIARSLLSGDKNSSNGAADVLQSFRGVTSDPNGALVSWNITTHPDICKWAGIRCTRGGHISALNVSGKGLEGQIPPSLGSLVSLMSLDLSGNNFKGRIPSSLGLLRELRHLNLSSNHLQGSIPADISNCSRLGKLLLSSNNFSGAIPPELGALKHISVIDLSRNGLSPSIPSSLGNCSSLQELHLQSNLLTESIPTELGNLLQLTILDLSYNNLHGFFPKSLVNCSLLEELNLSNDFLIGPILPELGLLRRLTILNLDANYFNGSIPGTLGNLSSLQQLVVGGHPEKPLTGIIPSELGKLKNLRFIQIYNSAITGNIPPELGNLTSCQSFILMINRLTGNIPKSLGNLHNAYMFHLGDNLLSGNIPSSLGNLRTVDGIYLQTNILTGRIPASFQNLTRISNLYVSSNKLSGPILPELGNLTSLREMALDANAFVGELPSTFRNLAKLLIVYLDNNLLSGHIPPSFISTMAKGNTKICTLHRNNFSGIIPVEIGAMILMEFLDLSYNSLSGPIPESIGGCKSLYYLKLSSNQLTGELPRSALEGLNLTTFTVANNSLEGQVPPPVGFFSRFNSSVYDGNPGLCGPPLKRKCANWGSCSAISSSCHQRWFYGLITVVSSSILLLVTLIVVGSLCYYKRRSLRSGDAAEFNGAYKYAGVSLFKKDLTKTLTIEELRLATEGFCTNNVIGVGGQSTVFKAVFPDRGDEIIAIKLLHANAREAATIHQLFNEVKVLSNIQHRNLVSFYGFYANPDLKALLVEYVPNGDLNSQLHPGGRNGVEKCELNLETRLQIAVGVANALSYLHHECPVPVIHRDLKPANVLLEDNFNPKVSDFGISKLVKHGDVNEASASYLCGTIGYIPPEYSVTSKVSTEGDVYSYGMVLLELLTGKHPTADSFENGDTLVSWVSLAWPDRIGEILDEALISELPSHEGQLQMLLRVGLICTREDPRSRPSMRDVQAILTGVADMGTASQLSGYPSLEQLAIADP